MSKEELLSATLATWRRTPFQWGTRDCILSVLDFAGRLCGHDLGVRWRGRYDTEAAALRLLEAEGGPLRLLNGVLLPRGFAAVSPPQRGDIVVCSFGGLAPAGLWLGHSAAFRLEGFGMKELRFDRVVVLGAWRW